jgi:type IV secretion system protein VirD4
VHFAPASLKDARELSEMLGVYGLKTTASTGPSGLSGGRRTLTTSEQRRPLLLPQELLQLDREAVIIQPRGLPPVLGRRLHWKADKAFARRWRAAPMLGERVLGRCEDAAAPGLRQAEKGNLSLHRFRAFDQHQQVKE